MTPFLELNGIRKRFGATVALDGVDLRVHAGEILALVGENGAGKSTLMKIVSGVFPPDDGSMRLHGVTYSPSKPQEARRAGVAMVYQELSLAPHLSVGENILLGIEPTSFGILRRRVMEQKARGVLSQLGHSDIDVHSQVANLSVAEQQLVEIARALAMGCKVLVFDEPTSSLTLPDIEHLFELLRRLKSQGHAIVYISHFLEEVKRVSDRFVVLRDGRTVGKGRTATTTAGRITSMMIGREIRDLYVRSKRTPGEVVLVVDNLSGIPKPSSASLKLHRGEVLGIAGLLGSGRTELLRSIFGLSPIQSGDITFLAYVGPASPARRWMQGMGMVSEERKAEGLALSMPVADNITLSKLRGFGPLGTVLTGRQNDASKRWISRLQIKCNDPRQRVEELSGGNQQKVALARLLHHDVDVLLLDEPTRGIDVGSKAEIYRLIDELVLEGKAVIIVSSYFPELFGVCDRVAVMTRGRLHPARAVRETSKHQALMEATGVS
ncbi:MAG TPA: sugar ABC transporter ATP-binding protein [Bacteroidota bacterium]